MKGYSQPRPPAHMSALNSYRNWREIVKRYGPVDPEHRWRMVLTAFVASALAPLRRIEKLVYGPVVNRTKIEFEPVFILGHWRTGTTHLHNLLSQDPGLGFVSTFQTIAPSSFLIGRYVMRPFLSLVTPPTRPGDNMALSQNLPQEDEFVITNVCPYSFYAGWSFPRAMGELFERYVLFNGISEKEKAVWRSAYLEALKKATYHWGGRRLVLKNPVNTARIPALLELFPKAKFIHIVRNPYDIFESTLSLYRATFTMAALQQISEAEMAENVLSFYEGLMKRFLEQRDLIPEGQFVETRYESLVASPLEELARIYDAVGLPGWAEAEPRAAEYVQAQAGYKRNVFSLSDANARRIEERWGFALDEWGYDRRETGVGVHAKSGEVQDGEAK